MSDAEIINLPARKYPDFRTLLAKKKEELEKELQDFTKLQTWYGDISAMLESNEFNKYVELDTTSPRHLSPDDDRPHRVVP